MVKLTHIKLGALAALLGCCSGAVDGSRYMWFDAPGADWETQSLITGCGRLGAAVLGGGDEIVTLSEDSIWTGPIQDRLPPEGHEYEPKIRELLLSGDLTHGQNLALQKMLSEIAKERAFSYFGSMHLDFGHDKASVSDYVRSLDTRRGHIIVSYTYDGVNYSREYIANYPSSVITARITASKEGSLEFDAYFDRTDGVISNTAAAKDGQNTITMEGTSGQPAEEDPILFTGQARFETDKQATVVASDTKLSISGTTSVDIFFDTESNYRYSTQTGWEGEMNRKLDAATKKGFESLRSEAFQDVDALISRASLDFGQSPDGQADLPLDQRILNSRDKLTDLKLVTLTWNFGRHLLVSSSRNTEGIVDMPPNLIGVWNNQTTARWGGKFTININTEMNLWPAEQTNLAETVEPLFELMTLAKPRGERMAKELYGCDGTVFHHNLDIWGDPAPTDNFTTSAMWPMGAAWLSQHMIEKYRFDGNLDTLRSLTYPFLVDVAKFYQCYAFEWEGNLVTGPSISPENSFYIPDNMTTAGQPNAVDVAPEMDNQLMRDVMNWVVEAAAALGISDNDKDVKAAKDFATRIREPRIGSYGQLLEWRYEYDEKDPGHRHLSPMYGIHPSNQFSPLDKNTTYFDAAKVLLDHRVKHGSGSTGWSRSWLVNQYARSLAPADAWSQLEQWFARFPTTALWNTDNGEGFQIDGNFGITSGLTEMVLQSQTGIVHILPALAVDVVPSGSFSGLVARGGFEVDAVWKDGKLASAKVTSKRGNDLSLRLQDGGEDFSVNGKLYKGIMTTETGKSYEITPSKPKCKRHRPS